MIKTLQPRHDVDRQYVSGKGGEEHASIGDGINASIQLENYIKPYGRRLITATRNNKNNTSINRAKITRKQI